MSNISLDRAIAAAEKALTTRGISKERQRARWQAIGRVADFIETHPEEVWSFVDKWGRSRSKDVRMAVSTCLLEHLLEHWFDRFFPRIEDAVRSDHKFADTFSYCWEFGQTERAENRKRFKALQKIAHASAVTRGGRPRTRVRQAAREK